jgi:hypothetical protein
LRPYAELKILIIVALVVCYYTYNIAPLYPIVNRKD